MYKKKYEMLGAGVFNETINIIRKLDIELG
jgi:hypothetical protein